MSKKKGFFQRIKEAIQEGQEDTLRDMRRWGREIGQAKAEGRKPSYANVHFAKDEILKRWHVDIVSRLRGNVNRAHNNEEADYLIQEALGCVKNKDTHNALVYLQGAYEQVNDQRIKDVMKKISKGPSLATRILMKGIKEKAPPDVAPKTAIQKYEKELPQKAEDVFQKPEEPKPYFIGYSPPDKRIPKKTETKTYGRGEFTDDDVKIFYGKASNVLMRKTIALP